MEILALLWGVVIGTVFSTVGAAGGILAGFGHISLFGIASANNSKGYKPDSRIYFYYHFRFQLLEAGKAHIYIGWTFRNRKHFRSTYRVNTILQVFD